MDFQGKLYRALNPVFAREPLSGHGASLYGGRFNSKGVPALYTSLSIVTAIKEANQAGSLQPTTLVSYDAILENLFDTRDARALGAFGMTASSLTGPSWRDLMIKHGTAPTQHFAEALISEGHRGLLVQSFAPGAADDDLNIVLWDWKASLALIDDEGRLTS
jgi:RES domain-containing protein